MISSVSEDKTSLGVIQDRRSTTFWLVVGNAVENSQCTSLGCTLVFFLIANSPSTFSVI